MLGLSYRSQGIAHDIGMRYRGTHCKLCIGQSVLFNAEFHRVKTVTQHEAQHGSGLRPDACASRLILVCVTFGS